MSSKELEKLVAKIQKQLSPDAEVIHDIKLPSRNTSVKRQIDVLVRQKIGQYEMTIAIDTKDYKKPVDVKGVEEFYGLIKDVGVNKGVLVCPSGFSKAAKERAAGYLIDLYSPVDTGKHKWQAQVHMPTVCDFREAQISFGISCSGLAQFTLQPDFFRSLPAHDNDKRELGLPLDIAIDKWNKGMFPTAPGEHENINLFEQEEVLVDNGHDMLVPVKIRISLFVKQQLFYGQTPISKISGFKDELNNHVITNAFEINLLDPNDIMKNWTPFSEGDDLPMPPGMVVSGLVAWG